MPKIAPHGEPDLPSVVRALSEPRSSVNVEVTAHDYMPRITRGNLPEQFCRGRSIGIHIRPNRDPVMIEDQQAGLCLGGKLGKLRRCGVVFGGEALKGGGALR